MRVKVPKVPSNFSPPETAIQFASASILQVSAPQSSELIIAPPATNQTAELMITSTSEPMEALQQIPPRTTKKARKSPRYLGFDNDDSSGNQPNHAHHTVAQVEPIHSCTHSQS